MIVLTKAALLTGPLLSSRLSAGHSPSFNYTNRLVEGGAIVASFAIGSKLGEESGQSDPESHAEGNAVMKLLLLLLAFLCAT